MRLLILAIIFGFLTSHAAAQKTATAAAQKTATTGTLTITVDVKTGQVQVRDEKGKLIKPVDCEKLGNKTQYYVGTMTYYQGSHCVCFFSTGGMCYPYCYPPH